ncbi:hypothetical protein D9758_004991 [Tetrapyrgos nigripes]|uniref:Enoyl reductase (ER) domain-containing protein n=1 Tax=Tetrapyrgos nigripes TaxID=182062 RepID=A0A8H5GWA6_9AGAR|nr:hypothetical protein D9758_004991 [Tetrapyrgos nigripes]
MQESVPIPVVGLLPDTQTASLLLSPKTKLQLTFGIPVHTPASDELLIKVHTDALNPIDWKIQDHGFFFTEKDYPLTLGCDVAGEVVGMGEGVDRERWKVGDRVISQAMPSTPRRGAFQQYMCFPADVIAKIPQSMTYAEASTLPLAFATAAVGLLAPEPIGAGLSPDLEVVRSEDQERKGQTALVLGGSSSVGQYDRNQVAFDELQEEIFKILLESSDVNSRDVDIVYDAVSTPQSQEAGFACLSPSGSRKGTLITVLPLCESLTSAMAANDSEKEFSKRAFLVYAGVLAPTSHREFGRKMMRRLEEWLESGEIRPNKPVVLPNGLNGIEEGLERLRRGEVSGEKLVVFPQNTH